MQQFCHSCTMPLSDQTRGPNKAKPYCMHCTDTEGNLKSKQEVLAGISGWLMQWQGKITPAQARTRAANFMKAMPAWVED
ncbi:hypothetical protein HYR53_04030 [Candidatus Acetothermia bacterium]|nr:hypothetical protein [Candidatus Acetothermia bacterium]